ncbi:MAG: hypothetical protein HKP30_14715 [Myxococcales bacterium]|nr:hypothetical protein [Myxococcales bacterium]
MPLEIAFALCALTLLAMIAPGFWLYRGVLRDLRERHPETWQALGRPTVVYYSSQAARRDLQRFVAEGRYEALDDPAFAAAVRRYRGYARVYSAVLGGLFVLFGLIVGMRWLAD